MRRSRWGSSMGVGAAWTYLLRVASVGFFGELSLGIAAAGKRVARRLRLAARMFSPGLVRLGARTPLKKFFKSRPRTPFGTKGSSASGVSSSLTSAPLRSPEPPPRAAPPPR